MNKVLKSKAKVLLTALLVLVITTGCNNKTKNIPASTLKSYEDPKAFLQSNASALDSTDNNNYSSFSLLDSSIKDKEIFLTGTEYGTKTDSELDIKLLKYFKLKARVKYYLAELPYSYSLYINKYLETGNERELQDIFANIKGSELWNKSDYEKIKKINEINKTLPESERIKIIGIDMERDDSGAFRYINSLLQNLTPPQKIEPIITELRRISKNPAQATRSDVKDICMNLKKSIEENRDLYNQYLGEKAFDLEMINSNLLNAWAGVLYGNRNDFDKNRNLVIYDNFNKLYSHLPKGNFYGHISFNSIFQKQQMGIDWFASLLNSEKSKLKGKVLSVALIHKDSSQMIPVNKGYSTRQLTTYSSSEGILDDFIKTDLTLFRLTGERSPFEKQLLWFLNPAVIGKTPEEGVTTDYFQYAVVIKNSQAVEPLSN